MNDEVKDLMTELFGEDVEFIPDDSFLAGETLEDVIGLEKLVSISKRHTKSKNNERK